MTYVVSFVGPRGTRRAAIATALVLAMCAVTGAQDKLAGTWQGETPSGTPIVLTLAVKGTALTGTLTRGDEKSSLTDGKVSKNTFSFNATVNGQAEGFSGELTGEEIKVWLDRQGTSKAIVLRRVKSK